MPAETPSPPDEAADEAPRPSKRPVPPARKSRWLWVRAGSLGSLVTYTLLMVPGASPPIPVGAGFTPFVWGQDSLWDDLQRRFVGARRAGCAKRSHLAELERLETALADLESRSTSVEAPEWAILETALFDASVEAAACPTDVSTLASLVRRLRAMVKRQSEVWPANARETRERVYRLLYGARAAYEEVLTQTPDAESFALLQGTAEPSHTPDYVFRGVTLHSGDILVSRGGAPTSALIARGNDFVGNFSHIALLHVSDAGVASVIEAHIERGVAVASPAEYLRDRKLRIMVLRPRASLPQLERDPLLPHRVATEALVAAEAAHIPYDFSMDVRDHRALFCSEVASAPYARHGLDLWQGLSSISGPGTARWLSSLGVEHFSTFSPSDLEYDPALRVVAEWRDATTLMQDRRDNAIVDVLLERADAGEELRVSPYLLPLVRLAKGYSVILNLFGAVGPIPEGMSASAALRVRDLDARHAAIAARVEDAIVLFQRAHGYPPPYWELVRLAREAERGLRL